MDTIRLKFLWDKPDSQYFSQKIHHKELRLSFISGSRFVWTNNTWRKEQQALGFYMPKYWIEQDFKYPDVTYFYFEASLPKLMRGENITPFINYTADEAAKAISDFCRRINIYIFPDEVKRTVPTFIAIGENINLTQICSTSSAIRVLKPFDYKTHSNHRTIEFSDQKHGGREAIFSQRNETTKAYDKVRELLNTAETAKEQEVAALLLNNRFYLNGYFASEILRIEFTLKDKRKIQSKLKPYLDKKEPTFENLFNESLWRQVLKDEVNSVFNHPLQGIIFLSLESQPFIDIFLNDHYRHIQTKDTIRGIISNLQERGLAETRHDFLKRYKSRQTWYNYVKRLERLQKYFDLSILGKLDSVKIHNFILEKFGIITQVQQTLGLNFDSQLSKRIDTKQRNT